MPTLGEYIHGLLKKAGADTESDDIKNFLLNGELVKIEMPDGISKIIDNNLISLKDAKNNHPDIKPHYVNQALTPLDQSIDEWVAEFGMDDDTKAEILKERSTYKRVPMIMRKIKELESKKANTGDKTDKAAYQKQIDDLHAAVRDAKKQAEDLKTKFDNDIVEFKLQMHQDSIFDQYETTIDKLPKDVKRTTLRTLLNKELQDKNGKFAFDENGNFVLLQKDGANFYDKDNNTQINPVKFIESVLSNSQMLVNTKPANTAGQAGGGQPAAGNQQQQQNVQNPGAGQGSNTSNSTLKSLLAESKQALDASTAIPVMGTGT